MPQKLQPAITHIIFLVAILFFGHAGAQTTYGISRTQTFVINPTTGAATTPITSPNGNNYAAQVGYESSAMAVSPLDGLLYMVERTATTTPRFATWNPATGVATSIGAAGTVGADILRSTFCPDGRWYVSGNGVGAGTAAEIYQLNPTTGAVVRTLNISALPQSGSGDIACVSDGTMYISAQSVGTGTPYQLFRLSAAQVAAGGAQAAALVGNLGIDNASAPNGLTEVTANTGNCVSPCLLLSGTPNAQVIYTINSSTGAAQTLTTASGAGLVDLSREFPRDVSVSKSVTPTLALQGRTLTYTINVANGGPAVAGSVTVADMLDPAFVNVVNATWTCSVIAAGSATALTTACASAAGTGNLTSTVNLSINSTIQFVITAPLLASATGTVSNAVSASLVGTTFDSSTANNSVTVTSNVTPAANLTVAKTNAVTSLQAGSTTSYTITVANLGPANAPNTVLTDPATPGLNCTTVTCAVTSGTASCPDPLTISALQSPGVAITPFFNANSTLSFVVTCGVTASGQ